MQGLVAHKFSHDAEAWSPGEIEILRIFGYVFLGSYRGLAVSGGSDQLAYRPFHIPIAFDKVSSQPVEKVGVGGPLALRAEIAGGVGDTPAKNGLPITKD